MIQPYTQDDLDRGREVVKALHGLVGFDAWAERIAKEIAAERLRLQIAAEFAECANAGEDPYQCQMT